MNIYNTATDNYDKMRREFVAIKHYVSNAELLFEKLLRDTNLMPNETAEQLRSEIDALREENRSLRKHNDTLRQERDGLKGEIDALTTKLGQTSKLLTKDMERSLNFALSVFRDVMRIASQSALDDSSDSTEKPSNSPIKFEPSAGQPFESSELLSAESSVESLGTRNQHQSDGDPIGKPRELNDDKAFQSAFANYLRKESPIRPVSNYWSVSVLDSKTGEQHIFHQFNQFTPARELYRAVQRAIGETRFKLGYLTYRMLCTKDKNCGGKTLGQNGVNRDMILFVADDQFVPTVDHVIPVMMGRPTLLSNSPNTVAKSLDKF